MSDSQQNLSIEQQLRDCLQRMARLGANITDSHSCFVFLPLAYLQPGNSVDTELAIGGSHSLCPDILDDCQIKKGSGLIGWVAKHCQPIHVSPFEHDSRTLGMYREDRQLKSFMGIPIRLKGDSGTTTSTGVITCDSKKSFAFSKLQGKLLSDLAVEVAHSVNLILGQTDTNSFPSQEEFLARSRETLSTLGAQSVEIIRIKVRNYSRLELTLGSTETVALVQQLVRLIEQSLPPHFPHFLMPNGDLVIVMDNMMTSFYENRIKALAEHIQPDNCSLTLAFNKEPVFARRRADTSLEAAITATCFTNNESTVSGEKPYEHRRA
jgi:hypothetical protein